MTVINSIADRADELKGWRRELHQHPEICYEEVWTSDFVAAKLESFGIEVHRGMGKTGVVGVLRGNGGSDRAIGLRADIDALPMQELNEFEHKSKIPGRMHACGHDGHTTMLLGAAQYLAETRNFDGTVIFIFQPAEEGLGGARRMISEGLFERFPCDELYGMHNDPNADPGVVSITPGPAMAGASFFDITIKGTGSHAAMPHQSRDPIVIGAQLVQQLQTVVSRNTPPLKPVVLSITTFNAGSAYNVVPDRTVITGTIRYFHDDVITMAEARMRELCAGVAAGFGVEIDVDLRNVFDVLQNDQDLSEAYIEAAGDIVGAENTTLDADPATGSEDFADMLKVVPGAYCRVGHAGNVPLHNPGFVLDDAILPVGASIYARIVEKRLEG